MIAFSEKEKERIESELIKQASVYLKDSSYSKIRVEDLTSAVGISKGAFYHFYNSKEDFFYEVMVKTHNDIYGEAFLSICKSEKKNYEKLADGIILGIKKLEDSGLYNFWINDSKEIIKKVSQEKLDRQVIREKQIYQSIFNSCGKLKVLEEFGIKAISTLISSSSLYFKYPDDYKSILLMMCEGVCENIFE